MCTVVVLRETSPGLPLVIAANRDELYERPTEGARREGGAVVSGIDRVSGGTWMGATEGGLVVAVTNQRTHKMPDPTKKSRGAVVRDALAAGSRAAIRELLGGLRPEDYNGFNLIAGDASGVDVAYVHGGGAVEMIELPVGVSVIANDRVGSAEFPRADLAAAAVARIAGEPWPRLATELAAILSDHTMPPPERTPVPPPGSFITAETARLVQAICIHTARYGTRSATIAAVGPAGLAHYLVTAEAPCRSPFFAVP
jgi:uncharacterized protein with NRDE domain